MDTQQIKTIAEDLIPIFKRFGRGKYAIALAGSFAKKKAHSESDLDFRMYADKRIVDDGDTNAALKSAVERWKKKGCVIDGLWVREIEVVTKSLQAWIDGEECPEPLSWAIWGYHVLPDIHNQQIVEDPDGVLARWKEMVRIYPPKLKKAIIEKRLATIGHWKNDYHYTSKVKRGDIIFAAGLSIKLIHDMIQILFALNETYYVGDGHNIDYLQTFRIIPDGFVDKILGALHPSQTPDALIRQREILIEMIGQIEDLVRQET